MTLPLAVAGCAGSEHISSMGLQAPATIDVSAPAPLSEPVIDGARSRTDAAYAPSHSQRRRLRPLATLPTGSIPSQGERLVVKERIADLVPSKVYRAAPQTRLAYRSKLKGAAPTKAPSRRVAATHKSEDVAFLRDRLRTLWEAEKSLDPTRNDGSVRRGLFKAETHLTSYVRHREGSSKELPSEKALVLDALNKVDQRISELQHSSRPTSVNRTLSSRVDKPVPGEG